MKKNTIRVDAVALQQLLTALSGPPHLIAGMLRQTNSPVTILNKEYRGWCERISEPVITDDAVDEARATALHESSVVSEAAKEYIGWRCRCLCYDNVWRTGDVKGVSQVGSYSAALHIVTKQGERFSAYIKGAIKVSKTPTA